MFSYTAYGLGIHSEVPLPHRMLGAKSKDIITLIKKNQRYFSFPVYASSKEN